MNTQHNSIINTRLEEVLDNTDLTEEMIASLRAPEMTTKVSLPFRSDDGKTTYLRSYRLRYNTALGPAKGGLRFHESVTEEEVEELAFLMSLKTALADIPLGGGKGGVAVNPKGFSAAELERLSRAFMRSYVHVVGPETDIMAPDVNTSPEVMAWMRDEYEKVVGKASPAVITGKPVEHGGSHGRDSATGRGAYEIVRARYENEDVENVTVAIQGFGNAGQHLARLLSEDGFSIVAISDSSGGRYSEDGLDIKKALEHKQAGNALADLSQGEAISNEDLLMLSVDVLAPAALGGVITEDNAADIGASVVLEVANAPTTDGVDALLSERDVTVIPDILTNAGGVIVSYFEWVQNKNGAVWSKAQVQKKLKEKMVANYKEVLSVAKARSLSLRTVAYYIAISRIAEAEQSHKN